MKKETLVNALDNVVAGDFTDTPIMSVPMVIPEKVSVPATISLEQEKVKQNLYDTNAKLMAVMDFLVNNLEDLSSQVSFIKTSPVSEICSVAKEIRETNEKLFRYAESTVNKEAPNNSKTEFKDSKITQNNIYVGGKKIEGKAFDLKTIDQIIKDDSNKVDIDDDEIK